MPVKLTTQRKGVSIVWDETAEEGYADVITIYATGEEGDVHTKDSQINTGYAGLFYPADFSGSSEIEIRDTDGTVISSGTISI